MLIRRTSILTIKMNAFIHRDATPIDGAWSYEPMGHVEGGGKYTLQESEIQFKGDERGFGEEGTSRIGYVMKIPMADIGLLDKKKPYSGWIKSTVGESDQRSRKRSGTIMEGMKGWSSWKMKAKTAEDQSKIVKVGPSFIEVKAEAGYPFDVLAPDIDYALRVDLVAKNSKRVEVRFKGSHNLFPFYELIVNGTLVWKYTPADSGPGLINLNTSEKFTKAITI